MAPSCNLDIGKLLRHRGLVDRDAWHCRAPHHEGRRVCGGWQPHLEERALARLEGWATTTIAHTAPHPRGAFRPSFAHCLAPPKIEGAGKAGWPLHPGPCAKGICASARTTGTGGDHTGLPCAMVYGLYVISSVNLAVCHRPPRRACASSALAPAFGAPGPHDFAVRERAARLTAPSRPPHSAPRSWRRVTPLSSAAECRELNHNFRKYESEIFFADGLDKLKNLQIW